MSLRLIPILILLVAITPLFFERYTMKYRGKAEIILAIILQVLSARRVLGEFRFLVNDGKDPIFPVSQVRKD
jgi:hypothetical protein